MLSPDCIQCVLCRCRWRRWWQAALLLDHGANPNIRNESGEYGDGNWSVKSRESRILEPVAQSDKTPLHIACESEDTEMAELLLSRVRRASTRIFVCVCVCV